MNLSMRAAWCLCKTRKSGVLGPSASVPSRRSSKDFPTWLLFFRPFELGLWILCTPDRNTAASNPMIFHFRNPENRLLQV